MIDNLNSLIDADKIDLEAVYKEKNIQKIWGKIKQIEALENGMQLIKSLMYPYTCRLIS